MHLDGCVEVEAAYYGAPPGWIGRRVHVQWDGVRVRLLDPKTGAAAARAPAPGARPPPHPRRGSTLAHADDDGGAAPPRPRRRPARRRRVRAHPPPRGRARRPKRSSACSRWPRSTARRRVDDAAKTALELGAPSYRFMRRYLERRPAAPLTLRQIDPLIRQLSLYRDLIQRKTGDPDMNLVETRPRAPQAAPVGNGRRPRNPTAPGADRDGSRPSTSSRRSSRDELLRRAGPALWSSHQAGALPRRRPLARHLRL